MTDLCTHMQLLIQAEHDGELDAAGAAALAGHVGGCAACAGVRGDLAALSVRLRSEIPRHAAPARLVRLVSDRKPTRPSAWLTWLRGQAPGFGLGAVLAAGVAIVLLPRTMADPAVAVVGDHIRALQPGHLTDVISTDRHTVKPWFDGRLDYAPPVRDFAKAGFPLIGGRLDYLQGRPVAALVYGRDKHLIDLYVWPSEASGPARSGALNGYNFVTWRRDALVFWAVSDVEAGALGQFRDNWENSLPPH